MTCSPHLLGRVQIWVLGMGLCLVGVGAEDMWGGGGEDRGGEASAAIAAAAQGGGSPAVVALGRRSRGHRRRFTAKLPHTTNRAGPWRKRCEPTPATVAPARA